MFNKIGIIVGVLFMAHTAFAECRGAVMFKDALPAEHISMLYTNCATLLNDDDSQAYLAVSYATGKNGFPKDFKKALYYYQLSAENGNAESQTQLAKLYMELDKTPATRKLAKEYQDSIYASPRFNVGKIRYPEDEFKGELMHPYTLLLLASERADSKWYYPSKVRKAPDSVAKLMQQMKQDETKRKTRIKEASAWKKRKLLQAAFYTLSPAEYEKFVATLYPPSGKPNAFQRDEMLKKFRAQYEAKNKNN